MYAIRSYYGFLAGNQLITIKQNRLSNGPRRAKMKMQRVTELNRPRGFFEQL